MELALFTKIFTVGLAGFTVDLHRLSTQKFAHIFRAEDANSSQTSVTLHHTAPHHISEENNLKR
jgi:hypothetical protein